MKQLLSDQIYTEKFKKKGGNMEFYVSRAMQVACLEPKQIETIQKKEKSLGYCLPEWNIQTLLGIDFVKNHFGIFDDDPGPQAQHRSRIQNEIKRLGWLQKIEEKCLVSALNVEATHCFDWVVFHNLRDIDFYYKKGKKKKSLTEEVLASLFLMYLPFSIF